jgi:hypothetical protein
MIFGRIDDRGVELGSFSHLVRGEQVRVVLSVTGLQLDVVVFRTSRNVRGEE